jgi:hypothetical protein
MPVKEITEAMSGSGRIPFRVFYSPAAIVAASAVSEIVNRFCAL